MSGDRSRRSTVSHLRSATLEQAALAVVRADTRSLPHAVAAEARRLVDAESTALVLVAGDGQLELLASDGRPLQHVERWRRFPRDERTAIARAVERGEAVVGTSGMFGDGERIGLCVPLLVDGAPFGALAADVPPGEDDALEHELGLLTELAAVSANALDRARRARLYDHATRLQLLTGKLVQAIGPDDVAQAIVVQGVGALGAVAGTVAILGDDGARLSVVAAAGYPEATVAAWREFPVAAPNPLAHAARTGEHVLLESREAVVGRFPGIREVGETTGSQAVIALPLVIEDRVLGALGFSFDTPRTFDWAERGFIRSLAELCAQALDRAQQTQARDRTARLQRITAALSRSSTLDDVAAVIAAEGAAALGASAASVAGRRGADGRLEVLRTIGDQEPLAGADFDALEAGKPTVGARRLVLPLRLRGQTVGAAAFAFGRDLDLGESDLTFLSTLAELSAQALERARLYERLDAAATRFRLLLERLQDGVIALRRDLTVGFANGEAQALLAVEDGAIPDRLGSFDLRAFAARLHASREAISAQVELRERTLELIGIPGDGEAVLVLRDVTRRERQERAEREFIANAAHELRTPLAGIAGAVGALQSGAIDMPDRRDRFLAGIAHETARLTSLVRALLVLARLQADPGSIPLERVELAPLLAEAAHDVDAAAGLAVEVDCDPALAVRANRVLLEAAIRNLVQNARRHTERGEIRLCAARQAEGIVVEVRDTGGGMSDDVRARAFERFYRAADEREGFGLGLPLVRELVVAHGGGVEIESAPGLGTTVRMTLGEWS